MDNYAAARFAGRVKKGEKRKKERLSPGAFPKLLDDQSGMHYPIYGYRTIDDDRVARDIKGAVFKIKPLAVQRKIFIPDDLGIRDGALRQFIYYAVLGPGATGGLGAKHGAVLNVLPVGMIDRIACFDAGTARIAIFPYA